jgi:hypothetical protein
LSDHRLHQQALRDRAVTRVNREEPGRRDLDLNQVSEDVNGQWGGRLRKRGCGDPGCETRLMSQYGTVAQMPERPAVHCQGRSARGRRPVPPDYE